MIHDDIFGMVGRTPSVRLRHRAHDATVFVKLEGTNPTGSVKDRACAFMLRAAVANGSLRPGKIILHASSGNFACALAFYGRMLGYETVVSVSSKLTAPKRDFLTYLGATMHRIGDFTIQGNEFCAGLAQKNPDRYCFLDQLHNWANPQAHYELTGPEILSEFPDVAAVVGSLGSGGTMVGIARYLKEVVPHVMTVVVECATGNRIPGTGSFLDGDYRTPFIVEAYQKGLFDRTVQITEAQATTATRLLLEQGLFCGLQAGGVVYAALACPPASIASGPIVVLAGDTGWKNLDKLLPLTLPASCG